MYTQARLTNKCKYTHMRLMNGVLHDRVHRITTATEKKEKNTPKANRKDPSSQTLLLFFFFSLAFEREEKKDFYYYFYFVGRCCCCEFFSLHFIRSICWFCSFLVCFWRRYEKHRHSFAIQCVLFALSVWCTLHSTHIASIQLWSALTW